MYDYYGGDDDRQESPRDAAHSSSDDGEVLRSALLTPNTQAEGLRERGSSAAGAHVPTATPGPRCPGDQTYGPFIYKDRSFVRKLESIPEDLRGIWIHFGFFACLSMVWVACADPGLRSVFSQWAIQAEECTVGQDLFMMASVCSQCIALSIRAFAEPPDYPTNG